MYSTQAVIVGAGHAGLAVSQQLKVRGVEHVVLERGRIGQAWRSLRWDTFALNTPTWENVMPGDSDDDRPGPADGFMSHGEWVDYLVDYAHRWDLPVREQTTVSRVEHGAYGGGYSVQLEADAEAIDCRCIVVASGIQNVTKVPPVAASLPSTLDQVPALRYRNPGQLRPGAVLVVGAGQTGGQIVEDLLKAGREAYWSVSAVPRARRRYRGRDILEWLVGAGFYEAPVESITDPAALHATMPLISGVGRYGHTLSLQWLAGRGATLIGRIASVDGSVLHIDDTVADCVRFGDQGSADIKAMIDEGLRAAGGDLPPIEADEADEPAADPDAWASPARLDLDEAGITTVIWATGVTGQYGYLPSEVRDERGMPIHEHGASPLPGIEFIGLPWLTRRGSGIVNGIVPDAQMVAERVAARVSQHSVG